jgi:SAM-dependent methyltransferase
MGIDPKKLEDFMNRAVGDMGAAASASLVIVGDKLGLYKALFKNGPMTSAELAEKTGTSERYVREWLSNQACGGYLAYDSSTSKFELPPEQAYALADETSPVFLPGGFQLMMAIMQAVPKIIERFKSGKGLDWGDHHESLFEGTERFFRPNYAANLVASWIPALEDVEAKLKAGATVADVGCGLGASTILMAQAYPKSKFIGIDAHALSIEKARERAKAAGVEDRIVFEVAKATDFPNRDLDLVCFFDCLHDMGDPAAVSKNVLKTLKKDGTWMIVEPFAGDRFEDNLNPVGRLFYAASTSICVPASLAQDGIALGAQAGEKRLKEQVTAGGFTRFRRATQTPFNLILEARP